MKQLTIEHVSINWYTPITNNTFANVQVGDVLPIGVWRGRLGDWRHFLAQSELIQRTTWHGNIDHSWRDEWLEFNLVFGEMVYNHQNRRAPIWKNYPEGWPQDPIPAAIAWRVEAGDKLSVACIWWGTPGQDAAEFRSEVLTSLPVPLTLDQRFASTHIKTVNVLVAAEPSPDRDWLVEQLTSDPRFKFRTVDCADDIEAKLNFADVVVLADELAVTPGGPLTCALGVAAQLRLYEQPMVGWPVNACRAYKDGDNYSCPSSVAEYLRAECGQVYVVMPDYMRELTEMTMLNRVRERGRSIYDLVLDALGVQSTTDE